MPVEQIDRVTRYAGGENPQPVRLGGGEWQRAKTRVRKAVGDLAKELLALYAARADARGRPFGEDTPWQAEMEAAFPYEETPDQLRAVARGQGRPGARHAHGPPGRRRRRLRQDRGRPAGRLQGHPGRHAGRRAGAHDRARRRSTSGRSSQRFAAYPITVRIAVALRAAAPSSRTRSPGSRPAAWTSSSAPTGCSARTSASATWACVIVDEEQRFGVTHKERLKQLKTEVHVLTLSATPIPRTLNLALVGVRDMSVIETPPEDRLPIQTRVAEASAGLVRDAILRELDRGGQVFFVHNRVETIEAQAEQLRRLLPSARIVVAHGQMAEGALERVMLAFAPGEHDVLVCTTIIESGLDIPNANTIIIDRADALGLAQLYQLRGRVGRSSRRAYAYLLYRRAGPAHATSRASGCRPSSTPRSWGPASRSRSPTWRSAAPATSWAPSSTATWRRSASTSTRACWPRLSRRRRRPSRAAGHARPARRPRSTCPSTPTCPTTTCPRSPRSWSSTGAWVAWSPTSASRTMRPRAARPLRPAAAARRAAAGGRAAALPRRGGRSGLSGLEDGQLVLRFGPDWSRADTMRALAPRAADDPLRALAGRLHYASNHLRVRPPSDATATWQLTRRLVERLAAAGATAGIPGSASGAAG